MTLMNQLLSFPCETSLLYPFFYDKQRSRWLTGLLVLTGLFFSGGGLANPSLCEGEQDRTRAQFQLIELEWPLRGSGDPVTQYLQQLGFRLAQLAMAGRAISWRFSVVRNLAPNAFSIGGGYVFITDGAVNFVQNESELAAILAHELGHELAGHFCGASDLNDSNSLFDIFSAVKIEERQVGIGSLTLTIDPVKEQEADQIALSILQAGGYDPQAMLEVARRLPKGNPVHLMDSKRLQALKNILTKIPPTKTQDSEDFLTIKRTLATERATW